MIDVLAFLRGLARPESLPPRAALITFDDGSLTVLRVALPWLREYGYPAVLFMPTDFVGRRNTFDAGVEPEEAVCDWDDLRKLEVGGISIHEYTELSARAALNWIEELKMTDTERAIARLLVS